MENLSFAEKVPGEAERLIEKVEQTEAELQEQGHEIEVVPEGDKFSVTLAVAEGDIRHQEFDQKDPYPLIDEDGELVLDHGIEEVIRAWVASPDGDILESLQSQEI